MSFPKLLLTIAVIAIIWFGFKYLARVAEIRSRGGSRPAPVRPRPEAAKPLGEDVQDMVRCRVCDTWQPGRTAKSCGRGNCPY